MMLIEQIKNSLWNIILQIHFKQNFISFCEQGFAVDIYFFELFDGFKLPCFYLSQKMTIHCIPDLLHLEK